MKKLISIIIVFGLISSQIGCAGKVTKISAPLDQVKFEKNYSYTVKLKTGGRTRAVTKDKLEVVSDRLIVKGQPQDRSLMSQDIQQIDGLSTTIPMKPIIMGGLGGALGGAVLFDAVLFLFNETYKRAWSDGETDHVGSEYVTASLYGVLVGGGLGLAFGAVKSFSSRPKVQITPVVSPTVQGGVDAGVNVGVRF